MRPTLGITAAKKLCGVLLVSISVIQLSMAQSQSKIGSRGKSHSTDPSRSDSKTDSIEIEKIRKVLAGIIAADNLADVDRIVAFYEDDAMLLPPAGPAVKGKTAIKRRYQQGFEKATLD